MYQDFALLYDRLMADVPYDAWCTQYQALATAMGISGRSCVDAACGTGALAVRLANAGWNVQAFDQSERMLAIAQANARSAGVEVAFSLQNLCTFQLHHPMDAVFCQCDGVNCLDTQRALLSFFRAAYRALKPQGGLFFDVSTPHKLQNTLGNNLLGAVGDDVCYLWQNHYSEPTRRVQMDITFFHKEGDGRYRRFQETHIQRAHTQEELTAWLSEAGFVNAQCVTKNETTDRWFFMAQKA